MTLEIPEKLSEEEWKKLPENFRPIYMQSDADPTVYEYAVPQLANSMRNAKQERDQFRTKAEQEAARNKIYEQFGDPEKIADLVSREKLIMDGTKNLEEAMSKAKREAEERFGGTITELKKEKDKLLSERLNDYQTTIINSLVANSGVDPEYEEEVRLSFGRRLRTEMRDGKPYVFVADEKNPNVPATDPITFDPLTPEKAFQEYRQKKGKFFKGDTEGSGSGFSPGRGRGAASYEDKDPKTWSFQEKKSYMDRFGGAASPTAQANYQKLLHSWADKRSKSA